MRALLLLLILGGSWLTWYRISLAYARQAEPPALAEAAGLTVQSGVGGVPVPLVDGMGEVRTGTGATERVRWQLLEPTAVGDLDGDGVAERVIVGAVDCGGSGTWRELVVLDRERAAVVQRAALDLGDRVEVHSLAFDGDRLVVGLRTHGSDDSMSAPTVPTLLVLRLVEGVLVPAGA
jgi:hypothetical protein